MAAKKQLSAKQKDYAEYEEQQQQQKKQPRTNSDRPVPIGDYDVVVSKAEYAQTTGGKHMVKVQFKILSTKSKGRVLFDNLVFTQAALFRVKAFIIATNVDPLTTVNKKAVEEWAASIVGINVGVKVEHKEWQGSMQAKICKFFPCQNPQPASKPAASKPAATSGEPRTALAGASDTSNTDADSKRIEIKIDRNNLHNNVADTIEVIKDHVFVGVNRQLVRIVTEEDHVELVPLNLASLTVLIAEHSCWYHLRMDKKTGAQYKEFDLPPRPVVDGVLSAQEYPGLRVVLGVSYLPIVKIDPKGGVIATKLDTGFIATGANNLGYYVQAKEPWSYTEALSEGSPEADAFNAYKNLTDILCDFPFDDSRVAKVVFVTMLLTLMLRASIEGAIPGLLITSTTPSSGKGLLLDLLHIVIFGSSASRTSIPIKTGTFQNQKHSVINEEELEKRLAAYAAAGKMCIPYDNIKDVEIGGPIFETLLTTPDRVEFRTLGQTQLQAMHWRALITFNAVNPQLSEDMERRLMLLRIAPGYDPTQGTPKFKYGDADSLRRHVIAHRRHYVGLLLTIIRLYFIRTQHTDGFYLDDLGDIGRWDYDSWLKLAGRIAMWASGIDSHTRVNPLRGRYISSKVATKSDAREDFETIIAGVDRFMCEKVVVDGKIPTSKLSGSGIKSVQLAVLIDHLFVDSFVMTDAYNAVRETFTALLGVKTLNSTHVRQLAKVLRGYDQKVYAGKMLRVGKDGHGIWTITVEHLQPRT